MSTPSGPGVSRTVFGSLWTWHLVSSRKNCVRNISPLLFEVGIPNLVCWYTLWSQSVACYFWVTLTLASDLNTRESFPKHISDIIWGINPKFGVWLHIWVTECHILFSGHFGIDLWPQFWKNRVQSISPILFEVEIPYLVCGYSLGSRSVAYCFGVTVTLSLLWPWPLVSILEKSCPDHTSYIIWGRNPKFSVWIHLGFAECHTLFLHHCDLDLCPHF